MTGEGDPRVWTCLVYLTGLLPVIQGVSYLYLSEARTYEEGRLLCQRFVLDLAKVTSEADIDDLHRMYADIPRWHGSAFSTVVTSSCGLTGLRYNILDGTSYEPDDIETDRCAVVKQKFLLWHTRHCTMVYPLLCGPYPILDSTPEPKLISFKKWREGVELLSNATLIKQRTSSRACAKDCSKLNNCMFYSLGGAWCRMYSDITSFLT